MSRTRLLRPAFFSDERMARLSAWTRLIYMGLWTLADDAGYFERKPAEIGVALFPYEPAARRLKRIEEALEDLAREERIRWLECGEHGFVPTLAEHGVIKGGNHAYGYKERHESVCLLTLFRRREAPLTRSVIGSTDVSQTGPVSESGSDSGLGSVSESGRAPARGLRKASEDAGGFVAELAARSGR
ncbi:MAG TPA: hypothetical protein VFI34_07505 [Candidatus Limnocylindrales bacterium]|nr:hypothetical protein [Candidatus Limnocylindrales bacterium]